MQLKLSDNIKRHRKEMGLTQEGLSEAFGVTIGAVSKWENGNNVPDILTLMELANFFNVSVDELLGYDMSSKNIDDMVDSIEDLYHAYRFDEAVSEANNALVRYPHTFKILYCCAELFYLKYTEGDDEKDRDSAISLYQRSMEHLSQNTDQTISEYSIRSRIAKLYTKKDPEKALDELKQINYDGCNDSSIASVLMNSGKFEESLKYGTSAMIRICANQYGVITYMALTLAASGRKKDLEKAIELADMNIALTKLYGRPDQITYFHKLQTIMLLLKSWWLSALGDDAAMKTCVKEMWDLANLYDRSASSNELSGSVRFYFSEDKAYSFDSTGAGAVSGIESMFEDDQSVVTAKIYKYMGKVIDEWNRLKEAT